MRVVFVWGLTCLWVTAVAQSDLRIDSTRHKQSRYFISVQSGALIRKQEVGYMAMITQGLVLSHRWKAGVGLGFTSYEELRTMPVMGVLKYRLLGKTNKLNLTFGYGWAMPSVTRNFGNENYGFNKVSAGGTVSPQVEYEVAIQQVRISLAIGLLLQRSKFTFDYPVYYSQFGYPGNESVIKRDYRSFGISLGVGWN